jgi:hypothetical protein
MKILKMQFRGFEIAVKGESSRWTGSREARWLPDYCSWITEVLKEIPCRRQAPGISAPAAILAPFSTVIGDWCLGGNM